MDKKVQTVKTIALVAHDNRKKDLVAWVEYNWQTLVRHKLVATGTTGRLLEETICRKAGGEMPDCCKVLRLKSGPLGGDQELGAMIANGGVDILVFFWDPMAAQPHDVDVKALLRIAVLYNVPTANNRSTADFLISSPLFERDYKPDVKDYSEYLSRIVS
ncbi:MAG TPA: methylglyoxal synthase [Myxococcota bacterium]|nr:methylglyoxal synthase [Myxococcota bacterium]HOD00730.1 methylglyoxal synthase [Myxococcota bacterium]HPV04710.1 methylglyoxal synthase [Myxococcota bacterium]